MANDKTLETEQKPEIVASTEACQVAPPSLAAPGVPTTKNEPHSPSNITIEEPELMASSLQFTQRTGIQSILSSWAKTPIMEQTYFQQKENGVAYLVKNVLHLENSVRLAQIEVLRRVAEEALDNPQFNDTERGKMMIGALLAVKNMVKEEGIHLFNPRLKRVCNQFITLVNDQLNHGIDKTRFEQESIQFFSEKCTLLNNPQKQASFISDFNSTHKEKYKVPDNFWGKLKEAASSVAKKLFSLKH